MGGEYIDSFFMPKNSGDAHSFSNKNFSIEFPKISSVREWYKSDLNREMTIVF